MKKYIVPAVFILGVLLSACKEEKYVHVGPNWAALHAIKPADNAFKVLVSMPNAATVGEKLVLKVKSEQAGRLWILQVDPNDEVSVMYPNALAPENYISAGIWTQIPAENDGWSMEATPPLGVSIVAMIVTAPGTDLSDVFNGQPNAMDKALRIVENSRAWGLAKHVVDIKGSE